MTTISAAIDRADFDAALEHARSVDAEALPAGLNAPFGEDWWARISQVWDLIEEALRDSFQFGAEFAAGARDRAVATAEELLGTAGRQAKKIHEFLLARLNAYLVKLVDAALARVRPSIRVAERELPLQSLEVTQKISLTGSLKANITDLVGMAGTGEIAVLARYQTG